MQAIHLETDLFDFWDDENQPESDGENQMPGESFARWLKAQLTNPAYELDEPVGEDWGWGFFATHGKERFWVAISFAGVSDDQTAGCWVVSVDRQSGLLGFFRKKDPALLEGLWNEIARAIEGTEGIRITLTQ